MMVAYSLINCWTRLYLGVHYPGDITVGLLWGAIVGYAVYRLHGYALRQYETRYAEPSVSPCPSAVTPFRAFPSPVACLDVPILVFVATLVFALGKALWVS